MNAHPVSHPIDQTLGNLGIVTEQLPGNVVFRSAKATPFRGAKGDFVSGQILNGVSSFSEENELTPISRLFRGKTN